VGWLLSADTTSGRITTLSTTPPAQRWTSRDLTHVCCNSHIEDVSGVQSQATLPNGASVLSRIRGVGPLFDLSEQGTTTRFNGWAKFLRPCLAECRRPGRSAPVRTGGGRSTVRGARRLGRGQWRPRSRRPDLSRARASALTRAFFTGPSNRQAPAHNRRTPLSGCCGPERRRAGASRSPGTSERHRPSRRTSA
jgi:hypothetical protein